MSVPETMKAAIVTRYGPPGVVEIQDRPVPALRDDTVLIRTVATTVNSGDARMRASLVPPGFGLIMKLVVGFAGPRQPILGTEVAGRVAAVGAKVTRFAVGDEVIAFVGVSMKCHAEYVAVGEDKPLVGKPEGLSFEEAAGLSFGGTTALHFLRKAAVEPGEHMLVIGASGAVGTAMVQLASHFGARVTAVCSGANAELVRGLGADAVIDYRTQGYGLADGRYDVIADCVAASSFEESLPALKPGGRYMAIAGGLGDLLARGRSGRKIVAGMAGGPLEDVAHLARLAGEGKYRVIVDSVFPFADIVGAHARVDSGHKRGSVVVRVGD